MNDAFENLEQQLRGAVRGRRRSSAGRIRRGHRRTWAIVAVVMLTASAGALAATHLAHGQSLQTQGRKVALQATAETGSAPACRRAEPQSEVPALTDVQPLKAITDLLPDLSRPASASEQQHTLAALTHARVGGLLLGQTLRTIPVAAHVELLVAVAVGEPGETVRDPVACATVRLARAMQLSTGRPPEVQRWAR